MSEESKKKMSAAKENVYDGDKNPMYGKHIPHTDEWRENASKIMSGQNNPMYGKKAEKTPVLCVETNTIYESRSEAARAMGIGNHSGRISRAIKRGGKACGYHWRDIT